jgi:hypothetical protein
MEILRTVMALFRIAVYEAAVFLGLVVTPDSLWLDDITLIESGEPWGAWLASYLNVNIEDARLLALLVFLGLLWLFRTWYGDPPEENPDHIQLLDARDNFEGRSWDSVAELHHAGTDEPDAEQDRPLAGGVPLPPAPGPTRPRVRRNLTNLAAIEARNKLGLRVRTTANELAAYREVRKYLEARGVRISHIQRMMPIAVELAFTPTVFEIAAAEFRSGATVARRHLEISDALNPDGPLDENLGA